MNPSTLLDYLNNTGSSKWDFKTCIDLIKEDCNCDNTAAYSYLNRLLKTKYNNSNVGLKWIDNWSNLVKKYEKSPDTSTAKPRLVFQAHNQTNYVSTSQIINQVSTQQQQQEAAEQEQQQTPNYRKGSRESIFAEENEEDEEDEEEEEEEGEDETIRKDFRTLVFKAGYDYFKYGAVSMDVIRLLNLKAMNHKPKTLSEALDILSYELISKEKNTAETLTLKLSLSHIIYFHGITLPVFDNFFSHQKPKMKLLYEKAKMTVPKLPSGLNEKTLKIFDDLTECKDIGLDELRGKVCQLKVDCLMDKTHDKELLKLLDIMDYIFMNCGSVSDKESEITCYRKAAYVLDILFRNTALSLIDGEHSSDATKDARNTNKKAVDDDDEKKDLIGRKIDLIIKGSEVEVSSSEWKKSNSTTNLIQQQRIKNIRTNSAMLNKISELAGVENLFLLGMDWVGYVGSMICLSEVCDIHCAHIIGDLVLPFKVNVLDMFKKTLNLLCILKQHSLNLLDIVTPALEKREIEEQLKLMDSVYDGPTVRSAPKTFFTPTKKRDRKN